MLDLQKAKGAFFGSSPNFDLKKRNKKMKMIFTLLLFCLVLFCSLFGSLFSFLYAFFFRRSLQFFFEQRGEDLFFGGIEFVFFMIFIFFILFFHFIIIFFKHAEKKNRNYLKKELRSCDHLSTFSFSMFSFKRSVRVILFVREPSDEI